MTIKESLKKYWKVILLTYGAFFLFFVVFPMIGTTEDARRLGGLVGVYVIPVCLGGYIVYYFTQRKRDDAV